MGRPVESEWKATRPESDETKLVVLFAAGSQRRAFAEILPRFERASGIRVVARFGEAGLLREEIEAGADFDVFASADTAHPRTLFATGRGGAADRLRSQRDRDHRPPRGRRSRGRSPENIAVIADYALTVAVGADARARDLVADLVGPQAAEVMVNRGFRPRLPERQARDAGVERSR